MKKFTLDELIALIPQKRDGTITAKELAKKTEKTESLIRKKINEARAQGIPICSTRFRYFISDDRKDIEATIEFLTHRINTQLQAIFGLKSINFIKK